MKDCRKVEGLIAAALYEPLEAGDQATLDAHIASCPACAANQSELRVLVSAIPADSIDFSGDLRPVVRAEAARVRPRRFSMAYGLVSSVCIVFLVGAMVFFNGAAFQEAPDPAGAENPLVQAALHDAAAQVRAGDYASARKVFVDAIAHADSDAVVGQLRLALADMEYGVFRRYEFSYNEYEEVRVNHPTVWSESVGDVKSRYDLLEDAREENFEPLYQMDRARTQGTLGIAALEEVMARYPGRTLAGEALSTMVSLVEGQGIDALESVKSRCKNPIAVAQLDVRLGEAYWRERNEPAVGRTLLEAVAKGPHKVPAEMARESLARLETPAGR